MKVQFPENFWWGSQQADPQTEGRVAGDGKGENIFDYWYAKRTGKNFGSSRSQTKHRKSISTTKRMSN